MSNNYEYLDLLGKKLDDSQKKVCCHVGNAVVAAGAGSGKTQTLATRFAWLVMSQNIAAEKILTLTFTKKAAGEMYERIYKILSEFANNPNCPPVEKKRAEQALNSFSNVSIQTLDSYCGKILKQAANRYGIRPDFSTGSSQSESNVKTSALEFVINHSSNPAILHFAKVGALQDFAENTFASLVLQYTSLATKNDFFIDSIQIQKEKIATVWQNLIAEVKDSFFALKNDLENISKPLPQFAFLNDCNPNFFTFNKEDFESNYEELSTSASELQEFLYNFENMDLRGGFAGVAYLKDYVKNLRTKDSDTLKKVHSCISYILEYPFIKELCVLLDEFTQQINDSKRKTGALTFNDVSEMALKVLVDFSDLRKQEIIAYDKIMIDEFQDNNGANRDLLFLLSLENPDYDLQFRFEKDNEEKLHHEIKNLIHKDKLFFVGDEKQSIYKFRGADVSVFNSLKKDLQKINGNDSTLFMSNNYRSNDALLKSFNSIFGGWQLNDENKIEFANKNTVFLSNQSQEEQLDYEAYYSESAIATKNSVIPTNCTAQNAHFALLIQDEEFSQKHESSQDDFLNSNEQQAFFVAKKIKEIHDSTNCSYSDFAILDKSRTHRHYLTRWLEKFEIPFKLDQQSKLFNDAPINDIYNFLKLCVYPSDTNAFSAFLCSPFVGLSQNSMQIILLCFINNEIDFVAFNPDFSQKIKEHLSQDDFEKYDSAQKFYTEQRKIFLKQPITKTISQLWYDCGYRYETMLSSTVALFAEQYDLLFELARSVEQEGLSLAWFVDQLSNIRDSEKGSYGKEDADLDAKDISYPLEKQSSVQIMTIHKSKGLQFEHVFILGCVSVLKNDSEEQAYFDKETGVSFKPKNGSNFFHENQKELEKNKKEAEFRRLIYVACTRAVKDFYLVGTIPIKKDGSIGKKGDSILFRVVDSYYPDFYTLDLNSLDEDSMLPLQDEPFSVTIIKPQQKSILQKQKKSNNIDDLRAKKIDELSEFYKNPQIHLEEEKINQTSPSALEELPLPQNIDEQTLQEFQTAQNLYSTCVKEILASESNKKIVAGEEELIFSKGDFGTLTHRFMENYILQNESISILPNDEFKIVDSQIAVLVSQIKNESDKQKILKICNNMTNDFANTDFAKLAKNSSKKYCEWNFKMMHNNFLITGSIDLIFQNDCNSDFEYTIIDYKTDDSICPQKYIYQQTCYKIAASKLLKIPPEKIACYLHFCSFNKTIDITNYTNIELTQELFEKTQTSE